jgi:predicted solute-binding protein
MYVNDYTRDYGESGRRAVREFLQTAQRRGYVSDVPNVEFIK